MLFQLSSDASYTDEWDDWDNWDWDSWDDLDNWGDDLDNMDWDDWGDIDEPEASTDTHEEAFAEEVSLPSEAETVEAEPVLEEAPAEEPQE